MNCGAIGKNPQYYTPRINARLGKVHQIIPTEVVGLIELIEQAFRGRNL
jgi:hypothetical protein